MHLVASVCVCIHVHVYVAKKSTCLMPYCLKKILLCVLYYLIMKFERLQSGYLRQVSCTDGAISACSI